jgi:hypothetical protein
MVKNSQEPQKHHPDTSLSLTTLKFLLQKVYFYYFYADKSTAIKLICAILKVSLAWLQNKTITQQDIRCISTFVRKQESLIPREMPENPYQSSKELKK